LKIIVYCGVALILAAVAAAAVGYLPTRQRWGAEGVESLFAVTCICLAVALLPAGIMALFAVKWPAHIGQAAFAGTAIRLMLTMFFLVVYQVLMRPHLASFLFWATTLYLLLLAIETPFAVLVVRRFLKGTMINKQGTAS